MVPQGKILYNWKVVCKCWLFRLFLFLEARSSGQKTLSLKRLWTNQWMYQLDFSVMIIQGCTTLFQPPLTHFRCRMDLKMSAPYCALLREKCFRWIYLDNCCQVIIDHFIFFVMILCSNFFYKTVYYFCNQKRKLRSTLLSPFFSSSRWLREAYLSCFY